MDIKLKHNNLCTLKDYKTVKEFLKELLFSVSSIKKLVPNKKLLQKELNIRDEIQVNTDLLNQKFINPIYDGEDIEVIDYESHPLISAPIAV